jgi:HD-like signal output (HDOD) protein
VSAATKITYEIILNRIHDLPTLPAIVYELTQVINDPMSSTSDVEKIMAKDQSMTTKVLKLVNSAYYAIPGGVTSLSRAIAYIGFDCIQQLVLGSSIVDALKVKDETQFNIKEFWKHSAGVSIAAETIAKHIHHPMPSDMFTCGLVHDMGKIALFSISPETISEITKFANDKKLSFSEAEKILDIPNHNLVGKLLAEKWKLPTQIQMVIKYHHELLLPARGTLSSELNNAVDIVYLSNLLIHALKFGNSGHGKILGAPKDLVERLNMDPQSDLKIVIQNIKSNLDKASDFIKVICG